MHVFMGEQTNLKMNEFLKAISKQWAIWAFKTSVDDILR